MNCDTILLYHFTKVEANKVCKIYQNKKQKNKLLQPNFFYNKNFKLFS
jgi:hypothetical protein